MEQTESILSWWERWPAMNQPMEEEERSENSFEEIVGDSPELKRMLRLAIKAARSDAPVLVLGEAGSGKELIARAIHRISVRRNESFVKIELFDDATTGSAGARYIRTGGRSSWKGAERPAGWKRQIRGYCSWMGSRSFH